MLHWVAKSLLHEHGSNTLICTNRWSGRRNFYLFCVDFKWISIRCFLCKCDVKWTYLTANMSSCSKISVQHFLAKICCKWHDSQLKVDCADTGHTTWFLDSAVQGFTIYPCRAVLYLLTNMAFLCDEIRIVWGHRCSWYWDVKIQQLPCWKQVVNLQLGFEKNAKSAWVALWNPPDTPRLPRSSGPWNQNGNTISDKSWDRMPDRMPDGMSNRMPDRIPDDMTDRIVRICVYIIVYLYIYIYVK